MFWKIIDYGKIENSMNLNLLILVQVLVLVKKECK